MLGIYWPERCVAQYIFGVFLNALNEFEKILCCQFHYSIFLKKISTIYTKKKMSVQLTLSFRDFTIGIIIVFKWITFFYAP